jgi:hypothetical protein
MRPHETGALEHAGVRLPRRATAIKVWRLVHGPMRLRRISGITSTAKGLSPAVRGELKVRAAQSLVIALDCAVQPGRDQGYLTTSRFMEALAERWSEVYRQTRKAGGTARLGNFRPETVRTIREEIVGQGIAYQKLWTAIRDVVPKFYKTSPPIKDKGRRVTLAEENALLTEFDRLLDADPRYRRCAGRAPRLLLADDAPPRRRVAQRVAGERPFDVMHIGPAGETTLQRLEEARVFLQVPELYTDIEKTKRKLAESEWPAIKQEWDDPLVKLFARYKLDKIPEWAPRTASPEEKFWATAGRKNMLHARKTFRADVWRSFSDAGLRA